jgi:hypothetical protein
VDDHQNYALHIIKELLIVRLNKDATLNKEGESHHCSYYAWCGIDHDVGRSRSHGGRSKA